jgi:hypothetical protein
MVKKIPVFRLCEPSPYPLRLNIEKNRPKVGKVIGFLWQKSFNEKKKIEFTIASSRACPIQ